jgi:hypothetical protein
MQSVSQSHPIPGCPAGLESLYSIDKIHVEQLVEPLEGKQHTKCSLNLIKSSKIVFGSKVFTGLETNNKYVVKNDGGDQLYYAFESESQWCESPLVTANQLNRHACA